MALDYTTGPTVMMQLGEYQFAIAAAAYQELRRTSEWRWPSQDRFGQRPVLQFTGPGEDSISLQGVIFPEWNGGTGQLDAMRGMADQGEALPLVDGNGSSMGQWVIASIEEGQTVFAGNGVPRRQEFTMQLKRAATTGAAPTIARPSIGGIAGGGVAIPAGATGALEQTKGLAQSVATNSRSLAGALNKAADSVQSAVAPFTSVARDALGAVNRSLGVVNELNGLANLALSSIGVRPVEITALLGAENLAARANRLLVNAESASAVLRTSSQRLAAIQGVPASATRAMQAAQTAANSAVAMTRSTAVEAAKIKGSG